MPRVLFIDVAPFVGGAQASFRTLIECAEGCDKALAVGNGLWQWASCVCGAKSAARASAPLEKRGMEMRGLCPALKLSTSHWRATLGGFLQYRWECWKNRSPLLEFIHSFKPDIIHCNTVRSALLLCALPHLEAKIIVHDRDLRMPSQARHYVAKRLSPFVFAISSTVCEKWRGIVPDDRRVVLFNGFDLEAIAKTKPALPDARNTVIIAADFEPWKRHIEFLGGFWFAQLYKYPSQLCAILKGRVRPSSAEYLEKLRNHVKECDIKNVRFIVDDTPALPWIASAQVLVTCSENEPFGRTAIEALALGKRVVATETALAPELFELDGVTRSASWAVSLSQAILQALGAPPPNPDLSRFSKETLAKELTKLYARIME